MRRLIRLVVKTVAIVLVSALAVPVSVVGTILASYLFLPLPAALPEPRPPEAGQVSRVYDQDGQEIGQFREFEQSIPVKPGDIPLHLKQAVISAEDRNFYAHNGVDIRGSMRALWVDIRGGELSQGGSTITQQYVKNVYVGKERTVLRKVREAVVASQLDRQADKDDILFQYLSTIYLGEGAYGVGAASETYFRKRVNDLTISEAALLAGLIPAPSRYEPRGNAALAEQKRLIVLEKMLQQGYITPEQHAEAVGQPLHLAVFGPPPGPATVVHPPQQEQQRFPYFLDYVRRYLTDRVGADVLFRGGLKIQTTLDPKVQEAAERAVAEGLKRHQPPIEMALSAVEPPTGYVKALVGGRDFYAQGGQVNLALGHCPEPVHLVQEGDRFVNRPLASEQIEVGASCWDDGGAVIEGGGTGRQPGSSWKAFVLAAAFEKGIPPTKVYPSPSKICIRDYCPQNYEGGGGGSSSLRTATHKSYNTVYVKLGEEVGIPKVMETAKKLGITTAWFSPVRHGLSLSLGAQEVAPLEMASAYGVFANRGVRLAPTPIFRVVDRDGNVLEDNSKREGERVLDEVVADNVTDVLRGVISGGTGTRADIGRPAAGKTGTAQEWRDAWFVGYTPSLSTAVWMGNREGEITLPGRITGGSIPAQTWKAFMSAALADVPVTEFSEPAPIKIITDRINRKARADIDPGAKRSPSGTDEGGPYRVMPKPPSAQAPVTTTTTAPPQSTTTTVPGGGDDGDDGDGPPGIFPGTDP